MRGISSNGQDQVRVFRTRPEVEELREFWSSAHKGPHADLDFFRFIIDLYPEAIRPHVIAVYRDNSPRILLIGRLEEKSLNFRIGYMQFRTNIVRILTFVHGCVAGSLTDHDATCLVRSIRSSLQGGEAEVACFESLDVNGPIFLRSLETLGFLTGSLLNRSSHYSRSLDADKTFLESLSSNARNHHKRCGRKLSNVHQGRIRIECFREPSTINRLMQDTEIVARKSYQRKLGVGFHHTSQTYKRLDFEARRGWLRGYLLYIEDRPSAYWIGYLYRGTFYSGYMAYDPAHAKMAPGRYLTIEVLKELSAGEAHERASSVDFGSGEAEYKTRFSNHSWTEATLFLFAPRLRCQMLRGLWMVALAMSFVGKKILNLTNVAPHFRRYWRSRIAAVSAIRSLSV